MRLRLTLSLLRVSAHSRLRLLAPRVLRAALPHLPTAVGEVLRKLSRRDLLDPPVLRDRRLGPHARVCSRRTPLFQDRIVMMMGCLRLLLPQAVMETFSVCRYCVF